MGEKRRVKIDSHVSFFCILDPFAKMPRFQCIAVCEFAILKNRIACMQIDLVFAGNQRKRLVHIVHQFLRCPRLARIFAGCLNAARQRSVMVEARHIVSLPAMHGNCDVFQFFNRCVRVHADRSVLLFCRFISLFYCHIILLIFLKKKSEPSGEEKISPLGFSFLFYASKILISHDSAMQLLASCNVFHALFFNICTVRFPIAVASDGPAYTRRFAACAVSRFK